VFIAHDDREVGTAVAGGSIVLASAPGLLSTSVRHKMICLTVIGIFHL
jgi:hypothetical protein